MSFLIPTPRRIARTALQLAVPVAITATMVAAGPITTAAFVNAAIVTLGYKTAIATGLFIYYGGVSTVIGLIV